MIDLICNKLSSITSLSQDSIWLTSTLSLSRNISSFKFLNLLSSQEKLNIIKIITKVFQKINNVKNLSAIRTLNISPNIREFISEKFFFNWPIENIQEQGFILDSLNSLFIGINFSDHLLLHQIMPSQEIEDSWKKLIILDKEIHKQVNYAFSEDFGFLTIDPKYCGTAFTASIYLHTPAIFWNKALYEFLEDDTISFLGLGNQKKKFLGDILILRNSKTLGISEESILSNLRIWSHKIIGLETKLRKQLIQQQDKKLLDSVLRSLGLLTHSYELSLEESLKIFSFVKLGIDLNIISNTDLNLNEIILHSQRGHLIHSFNNHNTNLTQEDILILRSKFIKNFSSKLSLIK